MDFTKQFWVRASEDSQAQAQRSFESENGLADTETKTQKLSYTWRSRLHSLSRLRQTKDPLTWNSTWKHLGPLAGLICLIIATLGTAVSFAILYASNGAPTREWSIQPSTYIAIVTAVVNQLLGYAAFQGRFHAAVACSFSLLMFRAAGAVISWWMRAMSGSTIRALHRDWHSGISLFGALSAGRYMNLIAVVRYVTCARQMDMP